MALGLLIAGSPARAVRAHARHVVRCSTAARPHGHTVSVRQTHRPARARRRRCRRHAATHHRAVHHKARHHKTAHHRAVRNPTHHTAVHHKAIVRHTHASPPATPLGRSRLAGPTGICQDTELRPSDENLERVRAATLCLVNRERAAHGEGALQANTALRQSAQGHTDSMVAANYFEHDGPGGLTPLQRIRDAGYIYSPRVGYAVGENIGWGSAQLGTPKAVVAAWMASPGHRANILDPRYKDTAIGVSGQLPASLAHGQRGGIYTQDFGVIITV
jgi:uncharacterized protein YkwD